MIVVGFIFYSKYLFYIYTQLLVKFLFILNKSIRYFFPVQAVLDSIRIFFFTAYIHITYKTVKPVPTHSTPTESYSFSYWCVQLML